MKHNLIRFSQRYVTALRTHLKQGPRAGLPSARGLGRQAVALGLETLDVARVHEGALATLAAAGGGSGAGKRAETFFAEVTTPIEHTHPAALKTKARLGQLNEALGRRTVDLATANRSLKKGITRRKTAEQALKRSGQHSQKQLQTSRQLQQRLQHLARQILRAQEDKRKKISRELHDEIAQTLLGINVRLLTLKKEAAVNADSFKQAIASTQRLVDNSVKSIKRFAREFGKRHET
ncbi:MAG: histidine kinase [Pedosphaera sp.]|nr:histidine kinase [Pedosphaera sp.]